MQGLESELDAAKAERDAVELGKRALELELHKLKQDKAEEIAEAVVRPFANRSPRLLAHELAPLVL